MTSLYFSHFCLPGFAASLSVAFQELRVEVLILLCKNDGSPYEHLLNCENDSCGRHLKTLPSLQEINHSCEQSLISALIM